VDVCMNEWVVQEREERVWTGEGVRYGWIMTGRMHRWMNTGKLREIDERGCVFAWVCLSGSASGWINGQEGDG